MQIETASSESRSSNPQSNSTRLPARRLGATGPRVSAIGLGCMGMSDLYGPADEAEGIATIHAALDAGVTLLDTGDFYGMGHNELLVRDALRGRARDQVVVSVKFGAMRDPAGAFVGLDARPAAVKNFLTYTLRRLGTSYVDIYRPARVDPAVPIEDTVGAIADLIKAGYVRHVGLSEAGADTIRRAAAVHPVSDLQIEYSLISRGIEAEILPTCRELGIGITAYGVLSRGLISGHWSKERSLAQNDFRGHSPRFSGENLDRNLALVDALRAIADAKGATVAQIAIGWVLARGSEIVPLLGARRRDRLAEALGALDVTLTPEDLSAIERAVPPGAAAGDRYGAQQMALLDSERSGSGKATGRG
jgi:aryl-alcohol dehydrogenase-like predicted oxidoreductase